jgi:hypothetical protein
MEAAMDVDQATAKSPAVSHAASHPLAKKAKALDRARAGGPARVLPPRPPAVATGELSEGNRLLLRLPRRWQVRPACC